jgi:hypothetical protein
VFQRIAQQTLEYLHTPHDVDLPANRQLLMAAKQAKPQDLEEGSPDRLGDTLEIADAGDSLATPPPAVTKPTPEVASAGVMPAAMREHEPLSAAVPEQKSGSPIPQPAPSVTDHSSGTVVLDAEQGGIVVPSFVGKTVRNAIEIAEENGLDLDAIGSGMAQDQSPPAGAHVPAGSHVTVKFGR